MADVDDRRPIGYLLLFTALALFVFASALAATGHVATSAAALFLGFLAVLGWVASRAPPAYWKQPLARAASLLVALLSLSGLLGWMTDLVFWNLLIPLLFFLLWPVRWALVLSFAFIFAAVLLIGLAPGILGLLRLQLVPSLFLVALLTGLFVYLREVKAQQLAPLRRTDALTLASTQENLHADLHTEIQRSEREGTALVVMHLALDPSDEPLPRADRDVLLRDLGRVLHEHLRIFDCYYRINETGFVLTLPCTETATAVEKAESIRNATAQSMKSMGVNCSVSAGVTALNVGDNAGTLILRAGEGLARAQARGGNRVQSWTDSVGSRADVRGGA